MYHTSSKGFASWWRVWLSWLRRHVRLLGPFAKGLPAVAAFAAVVYLGFVIVTLPKDMLIGRYLDRGSQALLNSDFRTARIGYERLTLLDPGRPEYRFGLALTLTSLGEAQAGAGIMQGLAPRGETGYLPAHLWLAQMLLRGYPTDSERKEAKTHLDRVLRDDPKDPDGNAMMAHVLIGDGRLAEAKPYLLRCIDSHPELRLALARVYALDPDPKAAEANKMTARHHGDQALRHYQGLLKADSSNHAARFGVADAAIFLGNHKEAVDCLTEGLRATGDNAFRLALGRAYLRWAQYLGRDEKSSLGERIVRLEKAIGFDFSSLEALQELNQISRMKGPAAAQARSVLNTLLARGEMPPATSHLMLGILAQGDGNQVEARQHFETAYQHASHMAVIVNNLAWSLANADPKDPARALTLIDPLVQRFPNQPNFRETRGQIHAQLKHWKEAVVDLETALPAMPKSRAVCQMLAEAYHHLNMPDLEKAQRQELERLPKP